MAVAERMYAEALFEAAKEHGRLETVDDEFTQFVDAVREVPELRGLLRNPELDTRAKQEILDDLLEDADDFVRNFLRLLVDKHRIAELDDIHREFERLVAREEQRLTVELTTAVELPEDDLRTIVGQIEKASGRKVEATTTVDPDLIGGVVLQVGTRRMDASVRGRIERLRRDLVRS